MEKDQLAEEIRAATRAVEDSRRRAYRDPSRLGNLVEDINRLAHMRIQAGDLRRAESLYREAMFRIKDTKVPDRDLQIGIISLLAHFYDRTGQPKKALTHYQEALVAAQDYGLGDSEKVGTFHNNVAMLYKKIGEPENAERHYVAALKIFERHHGVESTKVASVLNNLGVLYYSKLDTERSLGMHERALGIRKTLANGAGVSFDLGQSYNNLGAVYKAMGDFENAERCVEKAARCGVTPSPSSTLGDRLTDLPSKRDLRERSAALRVDGNHV